MHVLSIFRKKRFGDSMIDFKRIDKIINDQNERQAELSTRPFEEGFVEKQVNYGNLRRKPIYLNGHRDPIAGSQKNVRERLEGGVMSGPFFEY